MLFALTLSLAVLGGHHGHHSSSGSEAQASWLLDDEGKPWAPVETMTREAIMREDERLHSDWPSVGKPAGLLVLAAVLVLTGVGFTIGGAIDTAVTMAFSWALGVGIGCLAVGVVLFITAVVVLANALSTRGRYGHRLEQLERRLEVLDAVTAGPRAPAQLMTLATF